MTNEFEPLSFVKIAKNALKTDTLPDPIRNALYTIITKKTQATSALRARLIAAEISHGTNTSVRLRKGTRPFVTNALILWYLFNDDTTKTKSFLCKYAKGKVDQPLLNKLKRLADEQYLEFFCLGIVRESIPLIIKKLEDTDFNLFTTKLPSPFNSDTKDPFDITPMLYLYNQTIPWQTYMETYQLAEKRFSEKRYQDARNTLKRLEKTAVIRLPVIENLNRNIREIERENQQAWDYFQKMLS